MSSPAPPVQRGVVGYLVIAQLIVFGALVVAESIHLLLLDGGSVQVLSGTSGLCPGQRMYQCSAALWFVPVGAVMMATMIAVPLLLMAVLAGLLAHWARRLESFAHLSVRDRALRTLCVVDVVGVLMGIRYLVE